MTESVQGPAFTRSARVLALIAMILIFRQAVQGLSQMDGPPEGTTLWVLVLGAVGLLYGLGHIWFTQTQVDQTHIRQSGWVRSEVEIARLTQVKLIYIPYLSWLIAPRLVVRSGGVRSWVFHAADPKVLQRFWQLAHDAQTLKPPPDLPSGS